MRKIWLSGVALLGTLAPALAAGPLGTWLVEEQTAQIRVVDCGSVLWGVFAWEKTPGIDTNNPDPAMRNKPLLGSPLLLGLKPNANHAEWQGKVYNPQDGKQYDATISTPDEHTLYLKGCLVSILCKTVPWTRVSEAPSASTQAKMPPKAAPPKRPAGTPKPIDFVNDPDAEICSMIPGAVAAAPAAAPAGAPRPTH
jgi:uncharacterized protein (DUF2147 family)